MAELTIRMKVAERIAEIIPRVETEVVEHMIQKEVDKRTNATIQVLAKLDDAERDLRKAGPDVQQFDENGKKTHESFSKARIEQRNKLKGKIAKFTGAITKAYDKDDWSDLFNLAGGKDPGEDKAGSAGASDSDSD